MRGQQSRIFLGRSIIFKPTHCHDRVVEFAKLSLDSVHFGKTTLSVKISLHAQFKFRFEDWRDQIDLTGQMNILTNILMCVVILTCGHKEND